MLIIGREEKTFQINKFDLRHEIQTRVIYKTANFRTQFTGLHTTNNKSQCTGRKSLITMMIQGCCKNPKI